jgi:excisionase family DNA binding protein
MSSNEVEMGISLNNLQSDYSNEYITVRTAAVISGYNQQYIRRLLRESTFRSKRIGQLWLINRDHFIKYLHEAKRSKDKRFGPQHKPMNSN